MKSEELRHLTASELLTLEQEYEMQCSWCEDEDSEECPAYPPNHIPPSPRRAASTRPSFLISQLLPSPHTHCAKMFGSCLSLKWCLWLALLSCFLSGHPAWRDLEIIKQLDF